MRRFIHYAAIGVGIAALLAMAGCSGEVEEANPAAKQEPKAVEPVTGQTGLFEMYKVARTWAADLQILEVQSMSIESEKAVPAKAYAWTAQFYSPGKQVARTYTYAVEEFSQTLHEGVRAGGEEAYNPATAPNGPFLINGVKIDTPDALKTAMVEGKDYASKHPDLPIVFILERPNQFSHPAWRVVWGASTGVSNFSIYVDATTGKFNKIMH
jgi:hypothetical protein